LICAEASAFRIPDEREVFYLFNPFDEQGLGQVLSKIQMITREILRLAFRIVTLDSACPGALSELKEAVI
jgi:hypothetical protein